MKHVRLTIFGRVQGVFFRDAARSEAERLGVVGFARNEPDGTVVIEGEGRPEAVDEFVVWCRKGPAAARVERVEIATADELGGFERFEVL